MYNMYITQLLCPYIFKSAKLNLKKILVFALHILNAEIRLIGETFLVRFNFKALLSFLLIFKFNTFKTLYIFAFLEAKSLQETKAIVEIG